MGKIKHCVFMEFKSDYSQVERDDILQKLADLKPFMPGFLDIEFGINHDFENKTPCNAGFIINFENKAALEHYANHPEHQKLGAKLVSMCKGGGDGIIVFDLQI